MADVTDAAFRRLIAKYAKPDVMWTEFVSVDGLCSPGRDALLYDFMYTEKERPIVAQIFGSKPDNFFKVAGMIADLGFDGIDINMGCPDRNVEKQGGGAAMMKDASLAKAVIAATKEGGRGLPVSVKTRVGFNKVELDEWLPALLETGLAAVTIHARTRKEMSLVPANWNHVKRAVEIKNNISPTTLIIGNGDVKDLVDAKEKATVTGADGVMLGRAIFGNPWLFQRSPLDERFRVMLEHTRLFEELLGGVKNFAVMKKHYKAYVNGFDGAKELRVKLMEAENADEVEVIVRKFLQ
jgi:nifR3 family TIM-barrel protein